MGFKTAVVMYCDGEPAHCLRTAGTLDEAATVSLVARTHPDWTGETTAGSCLWEGIYPSGSTVYAGSFPAAEVLCDQAVAVDRPSELADGYLRPGAGRTMVLHAMHSGADFFAYAIWRNGKLVRSLSLSPRSGIMDNLGTPLAFEEPFWAGEHAIAGYPLPFHPLELGADAAIRSLFGFSLGGLPRSGDVDPQAIRLNGFTVPPRNPVSEDQLAEFLRTHKRTRYRLGPGGTLIPVTP